MLPSLRKNCQTYKVRERREGFEPSLKLPLNSISSAMEVRGATQVNKRFFDADAEVQPKLSCPR
jgi:hypothetical protein